MQYDPLFPAYNDAPANVLWFEMNPRNLFPGFMGFGLGFRLSYLDGQKLLIAPTASVD